jgi:hypothetical protein
VNAWVITRVSLIVLTSIASLVAPINPNPVTNAGWEIAITGFLFFPIIAAVGLFIIFIIPSLHNSIGKPRWSKNPFDFSAPEQFFHLGGYVMIFSGLVTIAARYLENAPIVPEHIAPVTLGLGVLIGLGLLTSNKLGHKQNASNHTPTDS